MAGLWHFQLHCIHCPNSSPAMFAEPLVEPQEYILEGRESVTTHVEIRKTSTGKKLRFDPINLFLRSSCMGDEENPVTVTASVFNHVDNDGTESIMFTPPCPAIQWAGSMAKEKRFVFGKNALDDPMHIDLSIFNKVCPKILQALLWTTSTFNTFSF